MLYPILFYKIFQRTFLFQAIFTPLLQQKMLKNYTHLPHQNKSNTVTANKSLHPLFKAQKGYLQKNFHSNKHHLKSKTISQNKENQSTLSNLHEDTFLQKRNLSLLSSNEQENTNNQNYLRIIHQIQEEKSSQSVGHDPWSSVPKQKKILIVDMKKKIKKCSHKKIATHLSQSSNKVLLLMESSSAIQQSHKNRKMPKLFNPDEQTIWQDFRVVSNEEFRCKIIHQRLDNDADTDDEQIGNGIKKLHQSLLTAAIENTENQKKEKELLQKNATISISYEQYCQIESEQRVINKDLWKIFERKATNVQNIEAD